jgi:TolB protein
MNRTLLLVALPIALLAQTPDTASTEQKVLEFWLKITSTGARRRLSLVIADFRAPAGAGQDWLDTLGLVQEVFEADLRFSLYFTFQQPDSGIEFDFDTDPRKVDLKGWSTTGAEVLVVGNLAGSSPDYSLELSLYDLATQSRIATKPYRFKTPWRWLAHGMADDVIQLLGDADGISRTRIAFSRQAGKGVKELAWCDYDGAGLTQFTSSGGVKLFPDWSPDTRRIAYCTYGSRSLNIYTYDIIARSRRTISERDGLNTTPAWSPNAKSICASLSFSGNSELYLMDGNGGGLRRLTNSDCIDISPSWDPGGSQIAFVSDRTGGPQVYVINADGTGLRRLTFEGSYNTSPAWSPRGDMVAFVQRQPGGANQICVTDLAGDTYLRLTTQGNNEDPCWSPDGLHMAFVSNRAGCFEVYTMDWNGANQRRITNTAGAFSPTWSPRLR